MKQISVSGVLQGNPLQLVHGTLWTIKYEFDCYLIVALLGLAGLLSPALRFPALAAVAATLAVAMAIHLPTIDYGIGALLISSPDKWPDLFPFFFAGASFYLFRGYIPKSLTIFVVSLATIVVSFMFGGAYWALLFCGTYIVLFVSLSLAGNVKLFGRRVDLSYGVYLYGWPIQQMLLFYSGMKLSPIPLFGCSILLSCLAAWISWSLVERPCLTLVRHRI
ncbi:MAG: hypothetical protein WDN48_15560 [Pseudolabrys sp.]